MSKLFSVGGYIAATVLLVLGIALVVVGIVGRGYVQDQLAKEQIVGTPDMTTNATNAAIKEAGLKDVSAPDCSVAGKKVDTGAEAKCFGDYMRIHTLEATGGATYAQMPRFATDDGKGTNDEAAATKGPDGAPAPNQARNIWVNETALSNALYTSFFAEGVALFAVIVGIALLLVGVGLLVLTVAARRSPAATSAQAEAPARAVPA